MVTVPINITGGTYRHKSLPLSAQVTRNFWPQKQTDQRARSQYILESFPGMSLFGTQTGGVDRGSFQHLDILYKVTGTTLYTVSSSGVHTGIGTIPGSERCLFAPIGSFVVIESGTTRYLWNGSVVSQITDVDLEAGTGIAHLNSQILYGGIGGRFGVSDVGDATSINGLNYATAESSADNLKRPYVFKQTAYMFGDETTEPWWNSGVGNPPFDRIEGGIMPHGLLALHSPANSDDYLYFLSNDHQVYGIQGYTAIPISPEPMTEAISKYSIVTDAIGWTMKIDGQWFYCLTFPTESKTWVYPEGGEWFEWSSGVSGGRTIANSYVFAFRKHLVSDYRNGNIYELDSDVYTENGSEIVRIRDTAPLHGGLLKAPGKTVEMNRFELIMETGVGILAGQGSDPVVMLSFSDDGGRTFSTEMWGTVGVEGAFQWKVEWHNLGSFESRIIRVRTSDPVYYSIYSAAADLEVGI